MLWALRIPISGQRFVLAMRGWGSFAFLKMGLFFQRFEGAFFNSAKSSSHCWHILSVWQKTRPAPHVLPHRFWIQLSRARPSLSSRQYRRSKILSSFFAHYCLSKRRRCLLPFSSFHTHAQTKFWSPLDTISTPLISSPSWRLLSYGACSFGESVSF